VTTSADHDAEQTLTEVRRLRTRAAAQAHGGVWLPVAVFAALVLLSVGLYRYPFVHPNATTIEVPYWAGLPSEQRSPYLSYAFWFLGTPLAFALVAVWYRRRGQRVGMRVRWQWAVGAGLGALVALAVIGAVPVHLPQDVPLGALTNRPPALGDVLRHGVLTPLLPVGVAALVLGLAERSRALVAAGAWIAVLAWLQCTFGLSYLVGAVFGAGGTGRPVGPGFDDPPGFLLLAMALPLAVFAVVAGWRAKVRRAG
jgi:hypothetical protein